MNAAANSFDRPSGEMTGAGGSTQHAVADPVTAVIPGSAAVGGDIVVGPVALSLTPAAGRRHQVIARRPAGGDVLAVDTIDLGRAGQRRRFVEQVLEKLDLPAPEAKELENGLDRALLQLASAPACPAAPGHAAAHDPEFLVIDQAADPELNGLYTTTPPAQIGNLDMRILEKVIVADEDREEGRLRLVIRRLGREHAFELTAAEFASNGRLRAAV